MGQDLCVAQHADQNSWLLRTTGADYFVFNKAGLNMPPYVDQDRRMVPGLAIALPKCAVCRLPADRSGAPKAGTQEEGRAVTGDFSRLVAEALYGSERRNRARLSLGQAVLLLALCAVARHYFLSRLNDASPKPFGTPIRFVAAPLFKPAAPPHHPWPVPAPGEARVRLAFVGDIMQHREQMH